MKRILTAFIILFATQASFSQDLENLIKGSGQDANYLVKGYISPALNTIGAGFAQGWYNTAKPHKLIGFDLTVTASAIYFPSSDLTYRVQNNNAPANTTPNGLVNLQVTPSNTQFINAPTVFGSGALADRPTYQLLANGIPVPGQTVPGASGLDFSKEVGSFIPVAMVQLGIGLPKGTDLKFRFYPSTKIGDNGSASMLGFGLMHDIKQHIPGIKRLPFDLSIFAGYTNAKLDVGLSTSAPDQKAIFETTATTVQALISKKLSVLTFYGGLGYNFTSASLAMKGSYNLGLTGVPPLVDPVNFSVSQSGPRLTAGMRLKLAIFSFHGDYTFQKYNALTVGFGLSIR
jgi:hypothetical protein